MHYRRVTMLKYIASLRAIDQRLQQQPRPAPQPAQPKGNSAKG